MCEVLDKAAEARKRRRAYEWDDFLGIHQRDRVASELERLARDGLLDGVARFQGDLCLSCTIAGLSDEGEAFYS